MKNIALTLCLAIVLAACSSGNSVSDAPASSTGLYRGAFESSNELDEGVMILNIVESETGTLSGTMQFEFTDIIEELTCFRPAAIEGTITGFNVNITAPQDEGSLILQLTFDGRSVLSGTYIVTTGAACSAFSGSGEITLSR